jgi:protein SCO1/2
MNIFFKEYQISLNKTRAILVNKALIYTFRDNILELLSGSCNECVSLEHKTDPLFKIMLPKMKKTSLWFTLPVLLAVLSFYSNTTSAAKAKPLEVGITEHLDEYLPSGIMLTDHNGKMIDLKQLINKPTVLCFVYYRCPGICSPLMNGLADVMAASGMALGKDYQAVTISIDSRENYELGQKKRNTYLKKLKGQDGSGWTFLVGDSANVAKATQTLGFGFKFENNEFMHEGALIMISPEGKITRYLKGISFVPFEFKLAVYEASQGKSAPTIIKVLKYCYSYDRKTETYSLDVTRITASITIIFAVSLLVYLLVRGRRRKSKSVNQ